MMFFQLGGQPQFAAWQGRMNRLRAMPRWAWVAVMIGVVLPIVVLGAGLLVIALASGLAVLLVVALVLGVRNSLRRLVHKTADDGRRNVKIVVHSARVVDP